MTFVKAALNTAAYVRWCVVNQLAGHKLTYFLALHRRMHKICSSHSGVRASSGKVDRPISELRFLCFTSPTQQHRKLSAHTEARETAGTVCVFTMHKLTPSSCRTWKVSLMVTTQVSRLASVRWRSRGQWAGRKMDEDKGERQADGQWRGTETEPGRQTGGQLRAVTGGMKSMSPHSVPTSRPAHMAWQETTDQLYLSPRQQRFKVSLRFDQQKHMTNWGIAYIFQLTSHAFYYFWLP